MTSTAMRRLGVALGASLALSAGATADEVKLGFLGGFEGEIQSMTPAIYAAAQLAVDQINAAGGLSAGALSLAPGDTGCSDAIGAVNAADRLVNAEGVTAIIGALCSGATIAAANSAAVPGGVVMLSPASTSPAVSAVADQDLVFRTVPSDAYQGVAMAAMLREKAIASVAVSYVNNDYGAGFAESFSAAFQAQGGVVAALEAHEDGKADYRAELGSLESTGADALVVLAYADGSGGTLLRQASESGVFSQYVGGDGMMGLSLVEALGPGAIEGMIGTKPGAAVLEGADVFRASAKDAGVDPTAVFAAEAYDAAYLLALAIEANGSTERAGLSAALRAVSSAPGERVAPGDWARARDLLAAGADVDYEGAAGSYEFDAAGDVSGVYVEMMFQNGALIQVGRIAAP